MNCSDFEKVVVAIARGEGADAAGAEHVKTCVRCARRLANEKLLSRVLAAAIEEDGERSAPPAVEQRLLAALRNQQATSPSHHRTWRTRAVVGAIAATVIVVAAVSLRRAPEAPKAQVQPPRASAPPEPRPLTAPVVRELARPRLKTVRATVRKPAMPSRPQAVTAKAEPMTEFIPIFYDPEPIERGQIVRVRLPRSALTVFGLPVNEERAEETIRADVLLGDDGLARAVRFVK